MTFSLYERFELISKEVEREAALLSLANEYRQSSDDLTRFARMYVVTGDERFKSYYFNVLDIRNGKAPRPDGYETVYWDLKLAGTLKEEAVRDPSSLRARLQALEFSQNLSAMLDRSEARSNSLVNLEVTAFQALEIGDRARAVGLLFGQDYISAKASIMEPVRQFQLLGNDKRASRLEQGLAVTEMRIQNLMIVVAVSLIFLCLAGLYRRVQ
jgi:methyl-accepting chemotaxis protein